MIARHQTKGLIFAIPGLVLQVASHIIRGISDVDVNWSITYGTNLAGTGLLLVGLAYFAKAKGQHPAWCLLAILSVFGFVILACMPDHKADEKKTGENRLRWNVVGAIAMAPIIASIIWYALVLVIFMVIIKVGGGFGRGEFFDIVDNSRTLTVLYYLLLAAITLLSILLAVRIVKKWATSKTASSETPADDDNQPARNTRWEMYVQQSYRFMAAVLVLMLICPGLIFLRSALVDAGNGDFTKAAVVVIVAILFGGKGAHSDIRAVGTADTRARRLEARCCVALHAVIVTSVILGLAYLTFATR